MYLYLDRRTAVHRLHPVVRVLGMAAFFVSAFVVERPLWQVPLLALLLGLLAATRSLPNIGRLWVLFVLIFVSTLLIWTLFYGPDGAPPLVRLGPLEISRTGPLFGLGMALKLDLFLGAGILFLSVTRIEEFAYALHRLGLPYKVGFTMTMAFRLVPVFVDAAASVVQAQRCRGFAFERGTLWQRAWRYVPVIVPVFMGGLRRADQMAMALDARGFQSGRARTTLESYPVRGADVAATLFLVALSAAYVALARAGWLALT